MYRYGKNVCLFSLVLGIGAKIIFAFILGEVIGINRKNNFTPKQYFAFFVLAMVLTLFASAMMTFCSAVENNEKTDTADFVQAASASLDIPEPSTTELPCSPDTTSSEDDDVTTTNDVDRDKNSDGKSLAEKEESKCESTTESKTSSESEAKSDEKSTKKETSNNQVNQPPESKILTLVHYSQTNDLPTGCELVSAKIALGYMGYCLSSEEILKQVKRSDLKFSKDGKLYGKSPFEAFIGNPKEYSGFGCYPPVIIDMVNSMGFEDIVAEDTSSLPLDFIAKTYINLDCPVLVWVTIDMGDSVLTDKWYLEDENGKITKQTYTWRAGEHCMVLIGYDKKYYYFSDPLSAEITVKYEKKLVEKRYKEVGCYSLVIKDVD